MFSHHQTQPTFLRSSMLQLTRAASLLALAVPGWALTGTNHPPEFQSPSPCGEILTANVDSVFGFEIDVIAANGLPDDVVVLTVTGDTAPLSSGIFTPPMPVGPSQPVHTVFQWTPSALDVGTWHLHFLATDQLGQTESCVVTIQVPPPAFLNICVPTEAGVMACPCSNPGDTGHGCNNSAGTGGALMVPAGVASLDSDTLHFVVTGELSGAFSVLLQANGPTNSGIQFGQGLRCISNNLKRLYTHQSSDGVVTFPEATDLPVSLQSASKGDGLSIGAVRYYLAYYRDPNVLGSCNATTDTFNASQGVQVTWVP